MIDYVGRFLADPKSDVILRNLDSYARGCLLGLIDDLGLDFDPPRVYTPIDLHKTKEHREAFSALKSREFYDSPNYHSRGPHWRVIPFVLNFEPLQLSLFE